jgi:branched-chain amino acid transport system ATP-binding protein
MLEVDGLSASYGAVAALHDVSFTVPPGTITTVLGANGAGKTTLLRSMTGLVKPTAGTVRYDGATLTGLRVEEFVRRGVAHVPEGRGVIVELTVEENLRLGTIWRPWRSPARRGAGLERIYGMFPALGERRKRQAGTLSGGERQMLAIGRALVAEPSLLLLDEPSLGLAPLVTAELMGVVRELSQTEHLTVVLVEQNVRAALSIAGRAVVLALGRVVVDEDAGTLARGEGLHTHYIGGAGSVERDGPLR